MAIPYPSSGVPIKLTSPLTKNSNIRLVQSRLISLGYSCGSSGVDGIYGTNTRNAIVQFQQKSGITNVQGVVLGIIEVITWSTLFDGVSVIPNEPNTGNTNGETTFTTSGLWNGGFPYETMSTYMTDKTSSYIINLATMRWSPLPVIPTQITKNVSANWGSMVPTGRSAAYKYFTSTENRTLSFSLSLHYDLLVNNLRSNSNSFLDNYTYGDLSGVVDFMYGLCYPQYSANELRPPVCILKIADEVKMRGYFSSVSGSHKLPIKKILYGNMKGKTLYTVVDLSLSFTEVPVSAPSSLDISQGYYNLGLG